MQAAGRVVQFLEEPLQDPAGLAAFHEVSGMAVALDETLDDVICRLPAGAGLPSRAPEALRQHLMPGSGVVALVVKPGVVGGIAPSLQIVRWGWAHGLQVSCVTQHSSGLQVWGPGGDAWLRA